VFTEMCGGNVHEARRLRQSFDRFAASNLGV
jgi:hypothetical protein